jgi:hypothetical protein
MESDIEATAGADADEPTTQELIDAGSVGFLIGRDGGAIVDPILPDDPEEAEKLKWRFDFSAITSVDHHPARLRCVLIPFWYTPKPPQ